MIDPRSVLPFGMVLVLVRPIYSNRSPGITVGSWILRHVQYNQDQDLVLDKARLRHAILFRLILTMNAYSPNACDRALQSIHDRHSLPGTY